MNKTDWTFVPALFSVALGWFLNELGQWFRTWREDKKIKKQILFNLLEANFIFNKINIAEIIPLLIEKLIQRFPENEQTVELKKKLNKTLSLIIQEMIKQNILKDLDKIEKGYTDAVDNLAKIDPLTAYRLNGKTKIIEAFDILQKEYTEKALEHFSYEKEEIHTHIELAINTFKPNVIKEAVSDLQDEIRAIACSISFLTWIKVKGTLKRTENRVKETSEKEIDEYLDKYIAAINDNKES